MGLEDTTLLMIYCENRFLRVNRYRFAEESVFTSWGFPTVASSQVDSGRKSEELAT